MLKVSWKSVALLSFMMTDAAQIRSRTPEENASSYPSKPHIVYILADDLGWNGVNYHNEEVHTPNINALAEKGVKLESFYAFSWCAPSRFALLTGRHAWKSEAGSDMFVSDFPIGTSLKYRMLPLALQEVGYATHMVGKWHQGFHKKEYLPRNRGFNTFYGILGESTYHFTQEINHRRRINCTMNGSAFLDMFDDDVPALEVKDSQIFSDFRYRKRAVELINEHDTSTPFFLYLSLQSPHAPFEAPEEFAARYGDPNDDLSVYYGMLSVVDFSVGVIVEALHSKGMYENTIIIFSSDNGAPKSKIDAPFNGNFPLRGHKGQLAEGGIRVPAIVSGGFLPTSARGRTLHDITSMTDWYATLAHVTGISVDTASLSVSDFSDSIDNWPYIVGEQSESARKDLMMHFAPNPFVTSSYRLGKWKYTVQKLVDNEESLEENLYDLSDDPGERKDMSINNPDLVTMMRRKVQHSFLQTQHMPWFAAKRPNKTLAMSEEICSSWIDSGGFLAPWADSDDETSAYNMILQNIAADNANSDAMLKH